MSLIEECKAIYEEAFSDSEEFKNLLFENCADNLKYLKKENRIVSMFFALPCEFQNEKAIYIFAAATKKSEQAKGYMSELLNEYLKEEIAPCFLRPATDSLCDFYEKFGFKKIVASAKDESFKSLNPKGSFLKIAEKEAEADFVLMTNKEIDFKIYFPYSMN